MRCILEWSKISNTCPLCKQRFWAIYQKRLDVSRLASNSDNVAEKFPGEVVATHIVMQRDPVSLCVIREQLIRCFASTDADRGAMNVGL